MERIIRHTRIAFVLNAVALLLFAVLIPIDQLFGLGWGFQWSDLLALIGMGVALCAIYAFCQAIFLFVRLTRPYS